MATEILGLDELSSSQSGKEVTHNTALRQIEGKTVRALDKDLTSAPGSPVNGDVYIVATGATGAWSGKDKKIAHFFGGSWKYYTPIEGNSLWVNDEDKRYTFDGTNWVIEAAGAVADGDYGDISVSGGVMTIDSDAVTFAKMQNISTNKLLGRATAGSGDIEQIDCTAAGCALIDDADAAAQRTTLGLGTSATLDVDTDASMAANSSTRVPSQSAVVSYVATQLDGRSWKQRVRVATTANGTLATAFANGQTVDGVTLATGDRILLKNQTTGSENGIYVVAASGAPTRSTDADTGAELVNATVEVSEGTVNADLQFTCSTNAPITVGTTALVFVATSTSTTYTADESTLHLSGSQFSLLSTAPVTHAATSKSTPVDNDEVGLVDSAASNVLKKLTWANIKATLKTYFDTLYQPVGGGGIGSGSGYPTASGSVGDLRVRTDGFPGQQLFHYVGDYTGLPVVVNFGVLAPTATGSPITVSMRAPVKAGNLLYAVAFSANTPNTTVATGWTSDINNNTPLPAMRTCYRVVAADGESVQPFNIIADDTNIIVHVVEVSGANATPIAFSTSKYNATAGRVFTAGNLALMFSGSISGAANSVKQYAMQGSFPCGFCGSNSSTPYLSVAWAVPLVDKVVGGAKSIGHGPDDGSAIYVEIAAAASGTVHLWLPTV